MNALPIPVLDAAQWQALEADYATPPRAYHSIAHVRALLRHFDAVAAGPGWRQPAEVWLAIAFHDAIYEPGRGDNERRSAQLARERIAAWWPQAGYDVERVVALIELTARHGALSVGDVDAEAALFLDCDMAILAAPPEVFDAYDAGIASEYRGHVPGFLYRINRRRFLRGLLDRPRIFLSEHFHMHCDADARANLRRVLHG